MVILRRGIPDSERCYSLSIPPDLSFGQHRAYRFTSYPGVPCGPLRVILDAASANRSIQWYGGRVLLEITITIAPKGGRFGQPVNSSPLQSIENPDLFLTLFPGERATLMTFTRSSELSNRKLEPYWLGTPSLTSLRRV